MPFTDDDIPDLRREIFIAASILIYTLRVENSGPLTPEAAIRRASQLTDAIIEELIKP